MYSFLLRIGFVSFLLLLASAPVWAEVPDRFAIGAGVTSFASGFGYAGHVTSPAILLGNSALVQVAHANTGSFSFNVLGVGGLVPVYTGEQFRVFYTAVGQYFFANQISSRSGSGVQLTAGGEFLLSRAASLLAQAGYSLAVNSTDRLGGKPDYGTGFTFLIGPRIFL